MKPLEATGDKRAFIVAREPDNQTGHAAARKTIVIVGVERGGTSMVAGVTRALGIDLGERAGRNHEDPKFLSDDETVLEKHIKENNRTKDIWGFKIPKASLKLGFYEQHLINPHYIIVFRNLASSVDSWGVRSGSGHFDSAKHVLRYYQESVNVLSESNSPVAFANYERACVDPDSFTRELARFLGVEPDEEKLSKAALVVTGDSAGYVDLPEYYFHMDSRQPDVMPEAAIEGVYDVGKTMQLERHKVSDRLVFSPHSGILPKEFFLRFDLEFKKSSALMEKPLRVYLDFGKGFFPGHAFRPDISNGENLIKILTNGNAKRVAIGSLNNEYVFGASHFEALLDPEGKVLSSPVESGTREHASMKFRDRIRLVKRALFKR